MTELAWEELAGKRVRVRAVAGSFAATRLAAELEDSERALSALRDLLAPGGTGDEPVEVYLLDPPIEEEGPPVGLPPLPETVGERGIVRVLAPGMPSESVAYPLARWAVGSWFGAEATAVSAVVEGIGGVVAARTSVPDTDTAAAAADEAVRQRLRAGRSVSVLGGEGDGFEDASGPGDDRPGEGGPPGGVGATEMDRPGAMEMGGAPGGPPDLAGDSSLDLPGDEEQSRLAATSFVAFLIERFGEKSLRDFLSGYDPDRRDQAAVDAFEQPLGAVEEAWRRSLGSSPRRQTLFSFVGYLLPYFKPYWRRQSEVFAYMVLGALLGVVAMPVAIGAVIEALMPTGRGGPGAEAAPAPGPLAHVILSATSWLRGNPQTRLWLFIGGLLIVYGFEALVQMRGAVVGETVAQKLLISLRERMFDHLQRLPHDFYARANVGDLMARLSGDLGVVATTLTQVFNMGLYLVISIATAAAASLTLDPRLGIAVLLVAPLFILAYRVLGKRVAEASYERGMAEGEAETITQENLSAHSVIKAFGLEDQAVASYHSRLMRLLRAALRMVRFGSLFGASASFATTLGQAVVLGVGGYLVLHGEMQIGVLAAFLGLLPALLQPLSEFSSVGEMVQAATGGMSRVAQLLEHPVTIADRPDSTPLPPLTEEIRLEHITFGYEADRPILFDVDLVLPAGKTIALVGPSGSGKSSIVNLLLRFWDPQQGRVLFDGRDIKDATLASLRGQIGPVFQDTFIFDTTVRENIAVGRPGASDADVEAAASGARLDEWIGSLPGGYDTVLGERGVRMSGGQRQRLAIARVLLRDPKVMILDEATSALDAETEAGIQDTLREASKGRTTIAVTHRLSMAASADLIVVLRGGRIVERGSHDELLAAGGLYRRLYETQVRHATGAATMADPALIRAVPLFSRLSDDSTSLLAAQLRPEHLMAGQDAVRRGDEGDRMYMIASGDLDVLAGVPGAVRRVTTLGAGDFFGETALLTGAPRNATVRATTDCELFSLSKQDFEALVESDGPLRAGIESVSEARAAALEEASRAVGAGKPS